MDSTATIILGIAIITAMFVIDLWFTRLLKRVTFKLIDMLSARIPWRLRYKSQAMPDTYARLGWRKKDR